MSKNVNLDSLLTTIGEFGSYQKRIYFLLGLPAITTAFQMLYWVFAAPKLPHRCRLPQEMNLSNPSFFLPADILNSSYPIDPLTKNYSRCEYLNEDQVQPCSGYVYDTSVVTTSILMTWDLVCDREWMAAVAVSLYMTGTLLGCIVFGAVSDCWGRKVAFYIGLLVEVVCGSVSALMEDFIIFLVMRFFVGMSSPAIFNSLYCLAIEIVGPSKRMFAGTFYMLFFTAGYLLTPGFGYFIHSWRILLLVISLVGILYVPYWWMIPESPRWLITKGRTEDAEVILKNICRSNNTKLPQNWLKIVSFEKKKVEVETPKTKRLSIIHLCMFPGLRKRTVNICFNWFINSVIYYSLSLNTSNLGGNPYLNGLLAGAVEVPAYLFVLMVLDRVGRRLSLCFCMVISGASLLVMSAMSANLVVARVALSMIGKLTITASFGIIYLYTAELYPTSVRNIAVGTGAMTARLGAVVSPYLFLVSKYWESAPFLICGILSCTAGFLSLLFPETLNRLLPETFEEAEKISESSKFDVKSETVRL